jgi:deoxycytidylate deaminase
MTTQERLLREYDAIEDEIESETLTTHWRLADWLAEHVPNAGAGRPKMEAQASISISDVSARRGRTVQWLREMRKTAEVTQPDRLPDVGVRVYLQALRKADWDLAKANKALAAKGTRLRDQAGPMESIDAIQRQLAKRTPTERAAVAAALVDDQTVIDAAYNDDKTSVKFHQASARLHSKDIRRDDERERVRRQMTEDQQRWEKFQRHIRAGEFGFADWQSTKFEVTDDRANWLRDRAEYLRHVATWLDAIAAHETVTDEALQRLLEG